MEIKDIITLPSGDYCEVYTDRTFKWFMVYDLASNVVKNNGENKNGNK